MDVGNVTLKLDKDWDMEELANLSKLYIQCYGLVYSLSGFKVNLDDERIVDWFQGAYNKYPWRGGFSTVNFYREIYSKIPSEGKPKIKQIHYASPGHIKLNGNLLAGALLAGIISTIAANHDGVHELYKTIQKGLSERKLTQNEVPVDEIHLDPSSREFVNKSKSKSMFIEKLNLPESMQSELSRRSGGNNLVELKILTSFIEELNLL